MGVEGEQEEQMQTVGSLSGNNASARKGGEGYNPWQWTKKFNHCFLYCLVDLDGC